MNPIKKIVQEEKNHIAEIRQTLHKIPEKGLHEKKTASYINEYLNAIPGLEITTNIVGTGILAVLKTGKPGKTLLIRADMDALPIQEETGLAFASIHENMMHACGHDGNMAMVMVAAKILSRMKDRFTGNVKFMFQPAEEGPGGAKPMIESGILENPLVNYAVAAHLWPGLPAGTLGIKPGLVMSAASFFDIEITGKGGHGAMPHLCVDALDTAVQVVNALQRIVSRKLNPLTPSVVTIGSLHAGTAPNNIPEKAMLSGTTRTFDKQTWQDYPTMIESVVKGICDAMGATYQLTYMPGYPPLENDPDMAAQMKKSMQNVVSKDCIREPEITMGAEDMSFVLEKTKGCMFLLGSGFEGCAPLHSSKFQFDDALLLPGIETYLNFTFDLLA